MKSLPLLLGSTLVTGMALSATLLFMAGALPDELEPAAVTGYQIARVAGVCTMSVREDTAWVDQTTADSLGLQPPAWVSSVRVPCALVRTQVLALLANGGSCTVTTGRPVGVVTGPALPPACPSP